MSFYTKEYQGNNNKTVHLRLTDKALELAAEAKHVSDKYMEQLFRGFSEADQALARDFFERICNNAEEALKLWEE